MSKPKKQTRVHARTTTGGAEDVLQEQERPRAHRPQQEVLTSVPARIVEDGRKVSHHIIDTLARTALAISNADNASEKLNVIQSLWNMQKEAEDRQAEREFNVAKVTVAQKLPAIPKTGLREFTDKDRNLQSSTYSTLDDIEGVLDPICRAYGITKEYSSRTDARGWTAQICTVRHVSGHKEVYESPYMPLDGTGSKNNNQAAGSTAKYGRRYALIGAFNIFHVDVDTDGAMPGDGSPKGDKFNERVAQTAQQEADKPKPAIKLSLEEAAAKVESKINSALPENRGAVLMEHIKVIAAMEASEKFAPKAADLRRLCEEQPHAAT